MRVLITHTYGLEGSGSCIYARNLARAGIRAGHEVHLAHYALDGEAESRAALEAAGVVLHAWPRGTMTCTYPRGGDTPIPVVEDCSYERLQRQSREIQRATARLLNAHGFDVVVANHFLPVAHGAIHAARDAGVPSVVVSHGTDVEYAAARAEPALRIARELHDVVGRRVALNRIAQARLAEVLERPEAGFDVLAPGIDTGVFRPRVKGPRAPHVVQVGRLLVDKGPHVSVLAVAALLPSFPDLRLTLVGDGPDAAGVDRLIDALDRGDLLATRRSLAEMATTVSRSHYLAPALQELATHGTTWVESARGRMRRAVVRAGYCNSIAVAALLEEARVGILPSMAPECYPLALLEAMALGCGIAATGTGGTPVLLEEAATLSSLSARIDTTRPVGSLVDALARLLHAWSPEQGQTIARHTAAEHAWPAVAERLVGGRPSVRHQDAA